MKSLVLLTLLVTLPQSNSESRIEKAKTLFGAITTLTKNFDPKVTELYSDKAVIVNTRRYPWGTSRKLELTGQKYKELLRAALPLAKMRGDSSTFSNIKYTIEKKNVRITATRYSELKEYESPYSLLVGPSINGQWLVLEEISESRP
jgi:hypothetical protein